ncbi:MAG: hypothetical protein HY360_18325 [Verrucomicrobia bacterium]|nr:hypothetical protein [Verrucomicrobiota bacterium]
MVIAIISLLAALLSPALKGARDSARSMTCVNNIRQFTLANVLFAGDHDGMIVPNRGYSRAGNLVYWQGLLDAYMGGNGEPGSVANSKMVTCPAMTDPAQGFSAWGYVFSIGHGGRASGREDQSDFVPRYMGSIKEEKMALFGDSWGSASLLFGNGWSHYSASLATVFRHKGRANIGFVDGHVQPMTYEEISAAGGQDLGGGQFYYGE